jgi:2-dehydro-3-deoxygluconokinase
MKKVVAFGELLLRLDTRDHERFVQAEEFVARYTGAEANVAVSLAHFGVEAFAVSKVPSHEVGQACVNTLRRYGVNTDSVVRGGPRLGILYVETGASQRPSKVLYDRSHSSFCEVRTDEFDWDALLAGKDWFHFSGTAPAQGESVRRVLAEGLRAAKRLGLTVSLDCNYRSTLWGAEEATRVLTGLMDDVDVFIGSADDAELLFGIAGEPAESAALVRQRFGLRHVAYTLREGGSASFHRLAGLLCDAEGCCTSREYAIQIVDRIGAGDAFTAGLIYGLLCGWGPPRTIDFATAASCLKHSIPGDFNLVSVEEVERLLSGEEAGRVQR